MNKPYYQDDWATIYHGDCREILAYMTPVDLLLTDPPYGTGWFIGGGKNHSFDAENVKEKWDMWSTEWLNLFQFKHAAIFCPDIRIASLATIFPKYRLRYYVKTNPRPALGGNDSPSVEPIFIFFPLDIGIANVRYRTDTDCLYTDRSFL